MNLIKKIQENIFRHDLFGGGSKIVIGVSGGPDSVCLLDALYKLKKKYNLELIIAHMNYGLRGKDSEKDERLVKVLAKKYSVPIKILRNKNVSKKAANLEEKLRKIRYDFFEQIRKKYKADLIAVAHNLNDQAETVLMRLLRGTGLRGLSAIKFRNANIIRPFLNIPRKEILAYLSNNRIPFRLDKSNLSLDFTRNKIRNILIPEIEKNFNPNIQETLYKFSHSSAADYDFIARFAGAWLAMSKDLHVSDLVSFHPAVCREILRQTIEVHNPKLRDIESGHIEEIIKILKSSKNKRQKIAFKGLNITRIGDRLLINKSK